MTTASLTFIHISDTHISHDPNYNRDEMAGHIPMVGAKALVKAINELPFTPDFVLHTGDVAYDPVPEAYETAKSILSDIRYPVYYTAGNHDDSMTLQQVMMERQDSEILRPLHYAFDVKGVQIACVDSNGPVEVPAGNMTPEQLDWLAEICTADDLRPLIIAVHHNPITMGIPWLDDYMGVTNGEDFHRVVVQAKNRLCGVFFGHVHQNIEVMRDGILYSACLSSWGQFHAYPGMTHTTYDKDAKPGFTVVTVSDAQTFIRRYSFDV